MTIEYRALFKICCFRKSKNADDRDGEEFSGQIVYNPDGSAYILEESDEMEELACAKFNSEYLSLGRKIKMEC